MRNLLLQLDSSPYPSVFDRVVALDAGADEVLSYGGVAEDAVRDLVHGVIFTRGPKDLHHTAIFIGGSDMAIGERLLTSVCETFFGPMRVSVMLDSSGSNTTAVAAVRRLLGAAGDIRGQRAVVTAGTGPVGLRAAGLLSQAGAEVVLTSRRPRPGVAEEIAKRFGGGLRVAIVSEGAGLDEVLDGACVLLNAGPAGRQLVPRDAWKERAGLRAVADLNAVPPLGIGGIDLADDAVDREGIAVFGALGVGKLKMKLHRACIARLFERSDSVLDVEAIAVVAHELAPAEGA